MTCLQEKKHTPGPGGYLSWHTWAAQKLRTHYAARCPGCGLYAIWRKREKPLTKEQHEALLYPPDQEAVAINVDGSGQVVPAALRDAVEARP